MGRHIIVESDELYHYGVKGMKWKDHVYATVEKAGNAVRTSAAKVAGATSAFAKKFGKKAKSAGVTAYERIRKKQHEANVKSGYKLKPKTDTAKDTNKKRARSKPAYASKADALATQEARRKSEMRRSADWHNNKNINNHRNLDADRKAAQESVNRVKGNKTSSITRSNPTSASKPHSRMKTTGLGKVSVKKGTSVSVANKPAPAYRPHSRKKTTGLGKTSVKKGKRVL